MRIAGIALATAAGARRLAKVRARPSLDGQVVLITGGSRGLGFHLARTFGRAGARVTICARNEQQVVDAAELLREGGLGRHGGRV